MLDNNHGDSIAPVIPQDYFQQAMEATPDAIVVADLTGRIVMVNARAERLFAATRDVLVGDGIDSLLPERFRGQHARHRQSFAAENNGREMGAGRDLFALRRDGSEVQVEIGLNPVQIGGERLVLASIIDITERKKLEARLASGQKLESLGVLAGGIAHDFNNLLTSILGFADLALSEVDDTSAAHQYIQRVVDGAHSAAELVRQMLAYSGKGKFLVEPLQLNELIHDMTHLLQVSISKKSVLQQCLADDLPFIEGDSAQLRQVIMNLIINASESIAESGEITITTGVMHCDRDYLSQLHLGEDLQPGRYVYCEVKDSGCGMSVDTAARLFDPFFTTKLTGRGLGMAAVLGIVRAHHGAIHLHTQEDVGTVFRVLLPPAEPIAKPQPASPAGNWQGKGLVLVVDDEEMVRYMVSIMLEKMGYDVITANDGLAGVEQYAQHADTINFVLLDMTMPQMNGEEAFREMRKIRPDVRVLLSSGYGEQETMQRFTGQGLAGFIQKPYRYEELLRAVSAVDTQ